MQQKIEKIEVYIWGKRVGAVALDPFLGYYVFAYDKKFGKSGVELSPIYMPLNDKETPFVFTDLPELTYKRLPAMISDSLPDDFGNALIDRYMADKGISKSQITILDRLVYMGKRSMGALEFKPSLDISTENSMALEMNDLVLEARQAVTGKIAEEHANAALRSLIDVGTSAGGARAKAVIAWNPKTEEIRSGQIDVHDDFQHWLIKFDGMGADKELGSSQDYGRIEYAYYLMAKKAGINMPECHLLAEHDRSHFMSKRFDREKDNTKNHMMSLCAMNHMDYKKKFTNSYEQFFMTIRRLSIGQSAETEAFRRMVFNIMSRNCDDHTKNFSFLLRQGGSWELSPAYDVTFAHNPYGEWTSQHLMSANGKFQNFEIDDLLVISDRFGIGQARAIVDEVKSALSEWPSFAKKAGVGKKEIEHIQKLHLFI
jgi:serine/threonine-protein kinase HipA